MKSKYRRGKTGYFRFGGREEPTQSKPMRRQLPVYISPSNRNCELPVPGSNFRLQDRAYTRFLHFEFWILGAIEPRGVGFETPNQLFLYSRKSEISFLSSGEKFKIVDSAFIRCSRSSLLAVMYLKYDYVNSDRQLVSFRK